MTPTVTQPVTQPIRIAVVGLGKIARDQHLPAIAASADFALAATVDPAGEGAAGVPHFSNLEALLASDCGIDAVAVCTPPIWRAGLAKQALNAGRHVLLEKPPAATVAQAEALAVLAGTQGCTLFAAWHSRYASQISAARAWLAGKTMQSVRIEWREDVRHWHPGQAWIFEEGGFGVFDPAINALSIVTAILPHPLNLQSAQLDVPVNCAAPIAGHMAMRDSQGLPVTLDMDFLQTGPQTWDIAVETDAGPLVMKKGGSELHLPGAVTSSQDCEYPLLYARFAALVRAGESDCDLAPLRLVEAALEDAEKRPAPPFHE